MVFSLDLSAYRAKQMRVQSLVPNSINELLTSQRLMEHYLKEIYGYKADDVEAIKMRQLTHGGVQGNLSDSARIRVEVRLVEGETLLFNWFVKIQKPECINTGHFDIFRNEIELYKKIIPHMQEFLTVEGFIGDSEVTFDVPEILFAKEEETTGKAIIILEDVLAQGYKHIKDDNGNKFLSPELAKAAVKSLAKIHAVSVAIQQKKDMQLGVIFPTLMEAGLFWTQDDMKSKLVSMKDTYIELVKTSTELDSNGLLKRFEESFASEERLEELCHQRCEGGDSVTSTTLQHGDFHFNNLLFKEEEGEIKVMIVDWQLAYSGKSTGDLSYLLLSSLSHDNRELYEEQIKQVYFMSFNKTLNRIAKTKCEMELMDTEYHDSLPLSFFLSCGNIMSVEEEEKCRKFSYEILKEAADKEII